MLTILGLTLPCLYLLWRHVGRELRHKGRPAVGFQFMAVGLWILGELVACYGFRAYMHLGALPSPESDTRVIILFLAVLMLGGVCGAGLATFVVNRLPSRKKAKSNVFAA
ncbi:MAG: hypothetical protein ACREJB_10775 [Planctomycetaceae bacterium]